MGLTRVRLASTLVTGFTAALVTTGCGPAGELPADGAAPGDLVYVAPPDFGDRDAAGALSFRVTDDESGKLLPVRVLFTAVPPTPTPRFDRTPEGQLTNGDTGTAIATGVIGSPEGVLLVTGQATLTMTPGSYDLFITHGPEWEADARRVTVTAGGTTAIDAPLRHSVDTRGWMAADLHVHTGRSFDSKLQTATRVVSEVTVGVELIVTTDHNVLTDLQPDVEQLGYQDLARAIVGDEYNFYEGHGGAYPMPYDGALPFGGTDKWKLDWLSVRGIHAAEMFAFLRGFPTRPAVSVNHPRLLPDLGYFTNLGWSPPMALADAGKFDALEVLSGYMQTPGDLAALLRDWFFLLNGGHRLTGLGSSDTHRLRDVHAGFPRSWIRMPSEEPSKLLDSDLGDALKAGRAIASNGPFVTVLVDGKPIGDLVKNLTGTVMVEATVDAPAWIDVTTMRVFVNGRVAAERAIQPGQRPLLRETLPVKLPTGDAWLVLQVGGKKPMREDLIGNHSAGAVVPIAITNPVYIDGDGDGACKPFFPRLVDADPGPIQPLNAQAPGSPSASDLYELGIPRPAHPAGDDCEPPLWADPSSWPSIGPSVWPSGWPSGWANP